MDGKPHYTNKQYARQAMTLLLNRTILFRTEERSKEDGGFSEFEVGVTFRTKRHETMTIWPTDQSDLNELQCLIE